MFSSHPLIPLSYKYILFLLVKEMYDYQGRSYLHIPQDVDVNLRSTELPDKCYLPKKQIHVWSGHTKVMLILKNNNQILSVEFYVREATNDECIPSDKPG